MRVHHANRLAVIHDPARNTSIQRDNNAAACGIIHIRGNLKIQLPRRIVI